MWRGVASVAVLGLAIAVLVLNLRRAGASGVSVVPAVVIGFGVSLLIACAIMAIWAVRVTVAMRRIRRRSDNDLVAASLDRGSPRALDMSTTSTAPKTCVLEIGDDSLRVWSSGSTPFVIGTLNRAHVQDVDITSRSDHAVHILLRRDLRPNGVTVFPNRFRLLLPI
ncbi:hypothetical protein GCM10009543_17840 [Leifsonia naganoensis]